MPTLILIIHLIVCLFLIFIVLIQSGKGAEMGAAFGGSSQTLFGGRGAATFLNKMTTVVAVVFMLTSMMLAVVSTRGSSVVKSVPAKKTQAGPASQAPQPSIPTPQAPATQPITPIPQQAPSAPANR